MTRKMRREKQSLNNARCLEVLQRNTSGVLALASQEHGPYPVPLSYVYDQGHLYFHCANEGLKLEIMKNNPRAAFCVIDQDEVVSEEYTTYYRSVIVYGEVKLLDEAHKNEAIEKLCERFVPGACHQKVISESQGRFQIIDLVIEEMTGKEAIELVLKQKRGENEDER